MILRDLAKALLYRSGLLSAYHRLRNRRHLTVVMFHRVLPEGDPRLRELDPVWTITETAFADCLDFFVKHYNVVSLAQLREAQRGQSELPERALLITFDDGWADNALHALPLLRKRRLPAVVFAVAGAIGRGNFWSEQLYTGWRRGTIPAAGWDELCAAAGETIPPDGTAESFWRFAARLAEQDDNRIEAVVAASVASRSDRSQVLSAAQLQEMARHGVETGSHGYHHVAMTALAHPLREMEAARERLRDLSIGGGSPPYAFAFPHGRYTADLLETARAAGYEMLFTSDECLNAAPELAAGVYGRIHIPAGTLLAPSGKLEPERLALWLFRRPAGAAKERCVCR